METDAITEIGIDNQERLYIKPKSKTYTMIYREAIEVHWDNEGRFLYGPKPREWSYFEWYKQIMSGANSATFRLELTEKTKWVNIGSELKQQIVEEHRASDT